MIHCPSSVACACAGLLLLPIHSAAQTKNRNRTGFGAGHEADSTPRAAIVVVGCSAIAVMIELLAQMNRLGWAGLDAQPASFTLVYVHAQDASIPLLRECHCLLLIVIAHAYAAVLRSR